MTKVIGFCSAAVTALMESLEEAKKTCVLYPPDIEVSQLRTMLIKAKEVRKIQCKEAGC